MIVYHDHCYFVKGSILSMIMIANDQLKIKDRDC